MSRAKPSYYGNRAAEKQRLTLKLQWQRQLALDVLARFFHSVSQSEANRHKGEGICDHFAVNHIANPPTSSAHRMEKDPVESRALARPNDQNMLSVVIFFCSVYILSYPLVCSLHELGAVNGELFI